MPRELCPGRQRRRSCPCSIVGSLSDSSAVLERSGALSHSRARSRSCSCSCSRSHALTLSRSHALTLSRSRARVHICEHRYMHTNTYKQVSASTSTHVYISVKNVRITAHRCAFAPAQHTQHATSRTHARWHARTLVSTHLRTHVRTHTHTHLYTFGRSDGRTDARSLARSHASVLACTHGRTSAAQAVCDASFHEIDYGRAWKPSSSSFNCYLRPSREHGLVMGDVAKIEVRPR